MKKITYFITGLGLTLIISGVIGASFNSRATISNENDSNIIEANMDVPILSKENRRNYGMMGRGYYGNGQNVTYEEKLSIDELKGAVEDYISEYAIALSISDIFVFEDSDYYFSITESETGMGAMELLVNPYTGVVYPEFGPNMMWNLKYGMHYTYAGNGMMGDSESAYGRGMMGGRGSVSHRSMMGNGYMEDYYNEYEFEINNYNEDNAISSEEAYNIGNEYLSNYANNELSLTEDSHNFYGYYTFHVNDEEGTIGMLSVNGFTQDVWYHDWHGELIEIISEEDSH